jgi:hypothetical protein
MLIVITNCFNSNIQIISVISVEEYMICLVVTDFFHYKTELISQKLGIRVKQLYLILDSPNLHNYVFIGYL